MLVQVVAEFRVPVHVVVILDERVVFVDVLSNFWMLIHELPEADESIAIAGAVKIVFLTHEDVRVAGKLVANRGILLQISL